MGNPIAEIFFGVPEASFNGRLYTRYPQGDAPGSESGGNASGLAATATASAAAGSASALDAETEWAEEASVAGVYVAQKFDYANTAAMSDSSYGGDAPLSQHRELVTIAGIAGKACRLPVLKTFDEGSPNYRVSFAGLGAQVKNVVLTEFYVRLTMFMPEYVLDHRFATVGDVESSHKFAIIQEPDQSFGAGELVLVNPRFKRCVGMYRITESSGQASHTWRTMPNSPSTPGTSQAAYQTIDAGPQSDALGNTDANNQNLWEQRHGFMVQLQSGSSNYGTPLSEQGQPDAQQAVNGVTWVPNALNTVLIYVNYDTQTVRLWHAQRGDEPQLVIDVEGTADLGDRVNNYTGMQLVPRQEERNADPTRQDTYIDYAEVLVTAEPPRFPGRHVPSGTLSRRLRALGPEQSTTFTSTWVAATGNDSADLPFGQELNWINKFFYDKPRKRGFAAAKIQGENLNMRFGWYSETKNRWVWRNCGFNNSGHVYDCVAYDPEEGAGYLVPGGQAGGIVYKMTWDGSDEPSLPVAATSDALDQILSIMNPSSGGNFASGSAAMDWHPNLFGPGDGGIVMVCQRGVGGWRKSTDTWHVIVPAGLYTLSGTSPACVYSKALDACIICYGTTGAELIRVESSSSYTLPGSDGFTAAPIRLGPDRGGVNLGCLVDDAYGGGPMIFEKGGSNRVWQYVDGAWPQVSGFTHPWTSSGTGAENWMVAAVEDLGWFALEFQGDSFLPRQRLLQL